ncbi:MAG: sulfatase-like hydrolase/transferase [Opitutae bacterium]|nr:sulfatase-like hydrolase/transferase [Opitutae bacterium]MBT5716979.1 sulfatase-like hydrolase/transferase [Opitutae bacterium]
MKSLISFLPICFLILANFVFGAKHPNILYLYVDDLGWGSIGPNGQADRKTKGKPYVLTPNLDRLAEQGVNFTRGYGCTVCSPARSSQQTGFHQGYTFADRNDPDNAKKAIRKDDITMGDALAQAGYATGYWGKWGYGGSKDMQNPTIDNVQTLPTSHGYKFVVAELHHVRAHTFFQPTLWNAPSKGWTPGFMELKPNSMVKYRNNKSYPNYPAFQNHPEYPNPAYCDDVYAFACLDFVRKQATEYNQSGKPFFGLFAAQIPHAPFKEVAKLPNWDQDYKDKSFFDKLSSQSKQWCAMVTRIDAHFGNILGALEDPNADGDKSDSVVDNTLVVFQSDNGGPRGNNREQLDANGGLQGSKGSIYEGGIRVPTIMRWPVFITSNSKLKAGTSTDMVLDCSDLLPTFCELAETKIPVGLSGVSIASTLKGQTRQKNRSFLIHETNSQASIIKGEWKLIRSKKTPHSATKTKSSNKKKKNSAGNLLQLYHLKNDHAEQNNLASSKPELAKELNALLTAERVDEQAGFANTYHDWKAKTKSDSLHTASNWTNYIYENAEITYMDESGSPQAHWTAKIPKGGSALAAKKTEFLSLELGGSLTVGSGADVITRNELRILNGGELKMAGGSVESTRWVDNKKGGTLSGYGRIKSSLYNAGKMILEVHEPFVVDGSVYLSGKLEIKQTYQSKKKDKISLIKGNAFVGEFENNELLVGGKPYAIKYSQREVYLVAK